MIPIEINLPYTLATTQFIGQFRVKERMKRRAKERCAEAYFSVPYLDQMDEKQLQIILCVL